jgi:hypothetical protein
MLGRRRWDVANAEQCKQQNSMQVLCAGKEGQG